MDSITKPVDKRYSSRNLVRLRINLAGTDVRGNPFKQTVFTRDVSVQGARLQEAPPLLKASSVVKVEYRGKKAGYRVVWVGGRVNDEVGLLSLEPGCIWGTPLPGKPISARNSVSN